MQASSAEASVATRCYEQSLTDMMASVQPLHLSNLIKTYGLNLKRLRLVSKEISGMANAGSKNCSVHLGEGGASPSPQQLGRLLGEAELSCLTVNVTVTAGALVCVWCESLVLTFEPGLGCCV